MTGSDESKPQRRPSREAVLAVLREAGYSPTREGIDRMRARLVALGDVPAREYAAKE